MSVAFEIEGTFTVAARGVFVAARVVDAGAKFTMPEQPTLGGVRIEHWLDMPRALDDHGRPRLDLFVFKLVDPQDRAKFRAGERALLV